MVALATAFVRLRLDTSGTKDDIDRGLRGAGGEKAADRKGRSIGAAFSKGFEGGGSTFARVAATMGAKATIAAAGLAAATPAVTQFVAAVAPAAGVAAALPVTLLAIKTTSLAAKVAVMGVGDAIKAGLGEDAKKAEEALKGVHGEARKFAVQMIGLKKPITDIQRATANKLFAPLVNEVAPLSKVFLPSLQKQLPQTAGALGQLGERVAHVAREGPALRALNAVFDAGQAAVKRMEGAVRPLVNGIANGLVGTAPQVKILAGYFADGAIAVGNFLTRAAKTGQLSAWITSGVITLKQLVAIFANLGAITSQVFDRATGGSNTLLARILELTTRMREFVESARGGQVVADLFKTMGVLGEALRKALAGVLPQVADSLRLAAPAAGVFATAVANVIISLGPLLPALTGVTVQLLTAVIPAMNAFAGWLSRNQELLKAIAPVILAYIVAAKAVAVATGAATIATRVWAVAVGVAKAAQAAWTAVSWLASAPVHAHTAAMRLSTSTIGTWIGVKRLEAAAWLTSVGGSAKATAGVVAHRVAMVASTVATKIHAAATVAWAAITTASSAAMAAARAGMLALNAAMRANPIGAIITVLTLLVGAIVLAYNKNETFRNIVNAVWAAIKKAIGATVDWFVGTAWPWIRNALNFLAKNFQALWTIVKAVWAGIKLSIQLQWQLVAGIFNTIKNWVTVTLPNNFRLLLAVARAVWSGIRAFVVGQVNLVVGIFNKLKDFITKTLPNAFRTGVDAIRNAWAKVQEAARKPVEFVVKSVINPLITGYNKIAGVFGAPKADPIAGFAEGGRIPGAPSATDNRMAQLVGRGGKALGALKVATGEFIVNARDTARALPLLQWVNSGMKGGADMAAQYIGRRLTEKPGDGSEGWAFAKGGLVGFIKDVWGAVSDPTKLIEGPVKAAIAKIPGAGGFRDMVVGLGRKLLSGMLGLVRSSGAAGGSWSGKIAPGQVGAVQKFVQGQAGKPYIWASAGPRGYDCSGIVSAAYNLLKGRNPYSHTFSTGSLPGRWFRKGGVGPLMAGWSHPGQRGASANVGHMAGQIGGMPFESTGSRGVRVGGAARRISAFANRGAAMAHGGLVNTPAFKLLDRGGSWQSGTFGFNNSGHTETVLTGGPDGDMAELRDLLAAILGAIQNLGGDVADALKSSTTRAVTVARGLGPAGGRP